LNTQPSGSAASGRSPEAPLKVTSSGIPGVILVEPRVVFDARGLFCESYSVDRYREAGIPGPFVQDNLSKSRRGVLRGLHLQHPHGQGKLVGVVHGEVFDVAVDVRRNSPTFRQWIGARLSGENMRQVYIPPGFAHGFLVLSDEALLFYKCTDFYHPESELTVRWNDPEIHVEWPMDDVILSERDRAAPLLAEIDRASLPTI
jgi:dTDP-4-dehydrorhamnose 3,5-epimerase